jgi:hypothetical protein
MVAIGLVSYGWYLWHWPILSFIRIARMDDSSLLFDGLGGGVLALGLACLSYRYVEQPIRRWRRSPGAMKRPGRIVSGAIAVCFAAAVLGGSSAFIGYLSTKSYLASHYGIEGRGEFENGCQRLTASRLPPQCIDGPVGMLLGDSHASVLFGSFARSLDRLGLRLVSIAGPGCYPLMFVPSEQYRLQACADKVAPFERLLARAPPVPFVIISGNWGYEDKTAQRLSDLIEGFDRTRTRILLIGPVPTFPKSSLECVVLSDRYGGNREPCVSPRRDIENTRATVVDVLKTMPGRYQNVRYIDPLDIFCDEMTCRPFKRDDVYFSDTHHVLTLGADRIYDAFESDFLWVTGRD